VYRIAGGRQICEEERWIDDRMAVRKKNHSRFVI
jgi:hypothetical protein